MEMADLLTRQREAGVLLDYDFVPEKPFSPYDLVMPLLLVGIVMMLVWAFLAGKANANNPLSTFGKARTVMGLPGGKKVTFADVAGADEEKQELQEIVDFLRNPAKYTDIGARIPHGLLLPQRN